MTKREDLADVVDFTGSQKKGNLLRLGVRLRVRFVRLLARSFVVIRSFARSFARSFVLSLCVC